MAITLPDHPAGLPIGLGWRADTGTAPVVFPYDGSTVAFAPVGSVGHAQDALDAGVAAVRPVAALSSAARRAILIDVRRELAQHAEQLVELLIAESGKTRIDCSVEVSRTLFTWSASAEEVAHQERR